MILRMSSITRMKKIMFTRSLNFSSIWLNLRFIFVYTNLAWKNLSFLEIYFLFENWIYNAKNIIQVLMVTDWLMWNVKPFFNKYIYVIQGFIFLLVHTNQITLCNFFFQFFNVVSCWPPFEEWFSIKWSHVLTTYLNSLKLIF
jgi:hypothetical protein